jgi:uncharacterized membrane protein SpoIIM required for sporulation
MNLDRFLDERGQSWSQLEALTRRAAGRPEKLKPDEVMKLGALYRAASADLALARRRWPADPVVRSLEDLVSRARLLVYGAPERRRSVLAFFSRGYWRLVCERPVPLLLAAVLLVGPALLTATWALRDPGAAAGLIPAQYQAVSEPRPKGADLGLSPGTKTLLSSSIFTNNIRVSFLAFAGGVAAGLVTAAVLLYNGVLLGTVTGLAIGAGNARVFFELVTAHGVLELSCIVVTAAAGLRMGWALIEPGRRRRIDSLVAEGRRAVEIVLGTAPWLVLAGLVEGFFTPAGIGLAAVLTVGFGLAATYWVLVIVRGTPAR